VLPYPADGSGARRAEDKQREYDGYIADHITLGDRWRPSFGLRYSEKHATSTDHIRRLRFAGDYTHATPNAGLVFLARPDLSIYASYSESFTPNSLSSFNAQDSNDFPPETSNQIEAGIKGELLNRKLNFIASAYAITKENVLEGLGTFTARGNPISVLDGEQKTKGLEFSGSWLPLPNWQVMSTLSYVPFAKTTVSQDVTAVGVRLYSAAKWSGSFWTRYNFTSEHLRGLGVGLGTTYVGPRFGSRSQRIPIHGRTLVDAAIYYQIPHYTFAVNIDNALDQKHFVGGATNRNSGINPGAPRRISVSVKFRQ
jgi:iron complex outermembrane receptor protein